VAALDLAPRLASSERRPPPTSRSFLTGLGWALGVGLGAIAGHKGAPEGALIDQGWGTIHVGDHIAVVGDWVFDSAHNG